MQILTENDSGANPNCSQDQTDFCLLLKAKGRASDVAQTHRRLDDFFGGPQPTGGKC
jgi:hypothetical protein